MYSANGKTFKSYSKAIAEADKNNSVVIEIGTGIIRWEPPAPPSARKMRDYKNRCNAYTAQVRKTKE